jgi:predicted DCC family thiol-disulfide oxidoreductase YuxK
MVGKETTSDIRSTSPPGRYVVVFDGRCKFCTLAVRRLTALARRGAIEAVSFHEPGVLDRFPGLTLEACMKQMYLVTPAGRVYGGFEAAVRAVATRRIIGWVALLYYLPGLRQLLDFTYRHVALRRYRIMGKTAADQCPDGTCALHLREEK